ncbi:MAG TPA: hypothetical protein VHW67_06485 [Solirubrobacteraceae bacterium]|nr:hypothetical protein [Solirubrobacteraceae bacterium]
MPLAKRTPRRRPRPRIRRPRLFAGLCAALILATLASGCGTGHPAPITSRELAEAQTFPYFRVYWVGPRFLGSSLSAADGQKGYITSLGDSVYYGDCVRGKGIFGGGSCVLPLQVTSVIYRLHSNATLGPQRNIVVRGVPATVYDGGRSIELYSGRVAIDLFSNSFAHAYRAARALLPMNAPGSAQGALPPPIYCPGLSGVQSAQVKLTMEHLPAHACQKASAALAFANSLS